jgi:TrwC relaxase
VAPRACPPFLRVFIAARVSAKAGVARFWKVRGGTVAIGLQKLSAGSGYEYLTRQVAAMDATGRGHSTLSAYYSTRGESPGHWYGGCLAGVGLAPGMRSRQSR